MSFPEAEEATSNLCAVGTSSSDEEKGPWDTIGEGCSSENREEQE